MSLIPGKNRPLTVAIAANKYKYGGGNDFISLITDGLLEISRELGHRVIILQGGTGPFSLFRDIIRFRRIPNVGSRSTKSAPLELDVSSFCARGAREMRIDAGPIAFATALWRSGADVVLPLPSPPFFGNYIPWVGYVYDCQHKYLPQLFSLNERLARDKAFDRMLSTAKVVIVNARAVADDIKRFYPGRPATVVVLPFAPAAMPNWFADYTDEITNYAIPERYFIICNQFWVHKDHMTAFKALKVLLNEIPDVSVVCTGATHDFRDPEYHTRILKWIDANKMSERVRILGHIPKRHQIEIMKRAIAVIQPTLFEGGPGGGAVYDAIGMGVPAIVSDISVNREIENEAVHFFTAGDHHALSKQMWKLIHNPPTRPAPEALTKEGRFRRKMLGEVLLKAVSLAMRPMP